MKYAAEVIELMSAHPVRDFRMVEIVRHACPAPASQRERSASREAVRVVLCYLIDAGTILKRPPNAIRKGRIYLFRWAKK